MLGSGSLPERGRAAARLLLEEGIETRRRIEDPFDPAFAEALVKALAVGLAERFSGIVGEIVKGSERFARNLNVEPEHGLVEVLQNADDLGATTVRFHYVECDGQLHIAHDGSRVSAPHVLAMAVALVTTKTDDVSATGKFGVGLSTLTRIAEGFEVQSWPYSFRVIEQRLSTAPLRGAVDGLYNVTAPDTMLSLRLRPTFARADVERWFSRVRSEELLFMRSVRRIVLLDDAGEEAREHRLEELGRCPLSIRLDGRVVEAEQAVLRDRSTGLAWTRVTADTPVPDGMHRADKETNETTPLGIAYPDGETPGRLYAGLPLAVPARLPFALNAQFDPETSRTSLLHDDWNAWLLGRLSSLAAATALQRFNNIPSAGWQAVPLQGEVDGVTDDWLLGHLRSFVSSVQHDIGQNAHLRAKSSVGLNDLAFEADELQEASNRHRCRVASAGAPRPCYRRPRRVRTLAAGAGRVGVRARRRSPGGARTPSGAGGRTRFSVRRVVRQLGGSRVREALGVQPRSRAHPAHGGRFSPRSTRG